MVAQPTATAYTDPGLASSTAYDYRVSAYNGVGVGGESGFAGLTETTLVAPPPAPANLRLNGTKTVSSIPVAWNAVAGIGLTYTLKRSADGGTTWVNAGTNLTATAYTDTGLTFNTSYKYQVFAVSSTGLVSDGSNPVSYTHLTLPTTERV